MQMRRGASLPILTNTVCSVFCFVLLAVLFARNASALPNSSAMLSDKDLIVLKTAQQKMVDKNYKQALKLSDSILTEVPAQFEAQFIRAQALSRLGKVNAAIELYQSILKSKPSQPEIYNNLASLYARQGKLDLALQTLDKGMATNAQYKTLYDNLSAIYVEMARGAYSKALKLGVQAKTTQLKTLDVVLRAAAPVKKSLPVSAVTVASVAPPPRLVKTEEVVLEQAVANATKNTADNKPVAAVKPAIKVNNDSVKPQPGVSKNKDEVINTLQGWAAAWSAQAVDLYLSFYGKDFKPVKLSKKVWAVQRRERIRKPRWVNVRLNNFEIKLQQKDKMVVQLVQDYRADNYRDKTKKQFVMQRTADGWRILSEKSVAVIR